MINHPTESMFNTLYRRRHLPNLSITTGSLRELITNSSTNEGINPLWNIREHEAETIADRFLILTFLDRKIIDGLKYRFSVNMNIRNSEADSYQTSKHRTGVGRKGHGELTTSTVPEYLIDNILTWNKIFADIHQVEVVAVQSVNWSRSKSLQVVGEQFSSDAFKWNGIPDAESILKLARNVSQRSLVSFTGRLRYTLLDRCLFTALHSKQ